MTRSRLTIITLLIALFCAQYASASAFVRGAYYRLGDDDPGATAGALGNDPTRDSFADKLDLTRFGNPQYTSNVPPNGPSPNKLAMSFANNDFHLPFAYYGRSNPLDMSQPGYALEAWVKAPPVPIDPGGDELIAYNGDPNANGFGFFRDGETGTYKFKSIFFGVPLGTATDNAWHHLGYVRSFNDASYFFDGKLVKEITTDPIPLVATGGFWIGGRTFPDGPGYVFNGSIDEVRYQSFNPLAAGAFDPTSFLISVPEPGSATFCFMAALLIARRGRRRS